MITAIHGLGSVGKSTLAAALAHDRQVQDHFCDGILWATLGQQPHVLSLLSGWVQALGDYNFRATSIETTSSHLRTLLYDKAILLIVDDAWNTEDAPAFNVGGNRCQVLVTTRETAIAKTLRASTYSLDVMKPEQAMELLTKKLERDLTGEEHQSAETLAKAVGYLPLALELAAAQIGSGIFWKILLQDIQQEIARLKTFDDLEARDTNDEASLKRLSLTASLNLSIQRLKKEEKENFTWLGVLPEDAIITPSMTATLWNKSDERDASDTLRYLQSKALLLLGVPLADGTLTYRLHDLFHDLARNLLTSPPTPKRQGNLPGLGMTLAHAHATFLENYRQKTQNCLWHTLPNDGYIHQHLVWHFEKAGQIEEIHQLLREETQTGTNGWYYAQERLAQTASYLTDINRAWELAELNWTEPALPKIVGLQCRYALISASLNSLAANLPVKLLIALIRKNVWTPEQGLAYALQSSNPDLKACLLTKLVNCLPPDLKELAFLKALAAAREIRSEYDRAYALITLADKLPSVLPEALTAAKEIQSEYNRVKALSALADKLPSVLPEALAAAREIQSEYNRAYALITLADKLPSVLPEALAAAREIQSKRHRAHALIALADKLPSVLPEALAAAREIQSNRHRAHALSALAEKLPPELLPEALAVARKIQSKRHRAKALSALAKKLPSVLPEALAVAREIQANRHRATALSALADKLPSVLPEALAAAREIQSEYHRANALSALADKLPSELFPEALAATREIQSGENRANALSALADKLPSELLPEALAATREIQSGENRAKALSALANKLPSELLPEALAAAREIRSGENRAKALSALADKLPPELLSNALTATRGIQSREDYVDALSALANKLPPELLPERLAAAREIQSGENRAKALSALADKLPPELLPEALAAAREIQSEYHRANALSALANKLPPQLLPEALAAAREIQSEHHRANALSALANKLPPQLLPEALAATREIQSERHRVIALSALANKLPPELLPDALATAREIQSEYNRAKALSALADKLPSVLPEALIAVREIKSEYNRAKTLSALADKLPPELLPEALATAREIQSEYNRAKTLSALADKLAQMPQSQLFHLWQDSLHRLSLRTRKDLLQDMQAILPTIFALGGHKAMAEVNCAIQDVARWWH